ncbi:TetR/AcrR family transcriptional regulator [Priestia megaterium]|uniref:TetR/AcrR family transcriptional regulator n=1 Tax=Priestia megaterium TaxID=1404 RepID=UPI002E1D0CC8|nr:TetR/AcrR family transcriptional regulator [Priestia megaterium]
MPKVTFFKLTEEKQKNLMDAAIYEFSNHSFNEVKISKIIKQANIPRSSFYDYFIDKEDLFMHLLSIIKETKQTYMAPYLQNTSSSFFDNFYNLLKAGAIFAAQHPDYEKLLYRLYEDKQLMHNLLEENQQSVISVYEELINSGINSGELRKDLDAKFVSRCIYHLSINLFINEFDKSREENLKDYFGEQAGKLLSLLKDGISLL